MAQSHMAKGFRNCDTAARFVGDACPVVPIAPRYDLRIVDAISALDDRCEPMAEICRRVGAYAESKGLFRPSYPHVRRLILTNRAREDELREIRDWVARRLIAGRPVDPYDVESKLRSAMELNGA